MRGGVHGDYGVLVSQDRLARVVEESEEPKVRLEGVPRAVVREGVRPRFARSILAIVRDGQSRAHALVRLLVPAAKRRDVQTSRSPELELLVVGTGVVRAGFKLGRVPVDAKERLGSRGRVPGPRGIAGGTDDDEA